MRRNNPVVGAEAAIMKVVVSRCTGPSRDATEWAETKLNYRFDGLKLLGAGKPSEAMAWSLSASSVRQVGGLAPDRRGKKVRYRSLWPFLTPWRVPPE